MPLPEAVEGDPIERQQREVVERVDARCAGARRQEGELAEVLSRAEHPDHRRVTVGGDDTDGGVTVVDQVQAGRRGALVQHGLAPPERPGLHLVEEGTGVGVVEDSQERPPLR